MMTTVNMKQVSSAAFKLCVIASAAALVACGGGGGGSDGAGTGSVTPGPIAVSTPVVVTPVVPVVPVVPTPPPVTPSVIDTSIATNVPAASYLQSSGEGIAYALLNSERLRCGYGMLAQNKNLDIAAQAHSKYSETNRIIGHVQDPTKLDFYGATIADRLAKAGYSYNGFTEGVTPAKASGENLFTDLFTAAQSGEYGIRRLFSAPYHANGLIRGFRDIGIGLTTNVMTVNLGTQVGKANQVSSDVRTYPCEGTSGTLANSRGENPNPFPNEANAIWGQPIIVSGSSDLKVTSANITGPIGNVGVKVIYGDGATTDPAQFLKNGVAAVIPTSLTTNTKYSVSISGTNKGLPFTRSFSFTTGGYTVAGYFATGAF